MLEVRDFSQLSSWNELVSNEGATVAFVPTMGALHAGHLSLVKNAKDSADKVVVSIFVNPTQFNDQSDLQAYPRMEDKDLDRLLSMGVDAVLLPTQEMVYPRDFQWNDIDLGQLDKVLEGPNRPGHFQGVAMVVHRLFELVRPDVAFFGQKDLQQVAVIRRMARLMGHSIRIESLPTMREDSGLAMSSRNLRLSDEGRRNAAAIYSILTEAKENVSQVPPAELGAWCTQRIESSPGLECEYAEVVEPDTFELPRDWDGNASICVAAWCEGVRLIDNLSLIP